MTNPEIDFLNRLLTTPGISGNEQHVQALVADYARSFCDDLRTDLHGNLIMRLGPKSGPDQPAKLMLAGHADQIGLIVSHVDDNGYLYFQTVGGWDPQQLVGQRVTIWGHAGPLVGVIARKPIHLMEESDRKQVASLKSMWIDIGAKSKDEASQYVHVGDSVTLVLGAVPLLNRLITGPALDDRTGLWVVIEAMRRVDRTKLRCQLFVASTVQEEIGLRGAQTAAYSIAPDLGIAVDVTHATDCPDVDAKQNGDIHLGAGPVIVRGPNMNPQLTERLESLARTAQISIQRSALGRAASNDSNALQVARGGVATAVVAIPNRYMHSGVEVCSLDDLESAANLLARFAESVERADDFCPRV